MSFTSAILPREEEAKEELSDSALKEKALLIGFVVGLSMLCVIIMATSVAKHFHPAKRDAAKTAAAQKRREAAYIESLKTEIRTLREHANLCECNAPRFNLDSPRQRRLRQLAASAGTLREVNIYTRHLPAHLSHAEQDASLRRPQAEPVFVVGDDEASDSESDVPLPTRFRGSGSITPTRGRTGDDEASDTESDIPLPTRFRGSGSITPTRGRSPYPAGNFMFQAAAEDGPSRLETPPPPYWDGMVQSGANNSPGRTLA
jgi:hypothetical protein